MDLALPCRSLASKYRIMVVSRATDRKIRCSGIVPASLRAKAGRAAAFHRARHQSVLYDQQGTHRRRDCRTTRSLQYSNGSSAGSASFKWKDPRRVIDAFQIARKQIDCTLVLVGNIATDDPEGQDVFAGLCQRTEERIRILSVQDSALVNALQRKAAVVLQKSIREGFGLTVTEAMWKGAAVIGGRTGGIAHQIEDGVNGFLVDSVEEAADRIVTLLRDRSLASRLGQNAKEAVRARFLMTRLVEDWLDLIGAFEANFRLRGATGG